jgi:hypothetical protein
LYRVRHLSIGSKNGILYGLGIPLLVFAEPGITGGIFDHGVTDVFIHKMPRRDMTATEKRGLRSVFQKWQANVRLRYYDDK